jgi:hypothetical protein
MCGYVCQLSDFIEVESNRSQWSCDLRRLRRGVDNVFQEPALSIFHTLAYPTEPYPELYQTTRCNYPG